MDLLEMLDAQDAAAETPTDVVHAMMPNFSTACGIDALELGRMRDVVGGHWYVLGSRGGRLPQLAADYVVIEADCAACITAAEPHGGLAEVCRAMQRNQAPVKS